MIHLFFTHTVQYCKLLCHVATLKVTDDDFVIIRAGEEMMGSRGEAHRANVAAVWAICLDYAASSDVIQHAGAVLLTCGQQAAAGIHCHRGNCTSCVRQSGNGEMFTVIGCSVFVFVFVCDVTHLSRAELCLPPGHSWEPAGPRTGLSCPESRRRSSILPTCTESECDLFKQNGELYCTGLM